MLAPSRSRSGARRRGTTRETTELSSPRCRTHRPTAPRTTSGRGACVARRPPTQPHEDNATTPRPRDRHRSHLASCARSCAARPASSAFVRSGFESVSTRMAVGSRVCCRARAPAEMRGGDGRTTSDAFARIRWVGVTPTANRAVFPPPSRTRPHVLLRRAWRWHALPAAATARARHSHKAGRVCR